MTLTNDLDIPTKWGYSETDQNLALVSEKVNEATGSDKATTKSVSSDDDAVSLQDDTRQLLYISNVNQFIQAIRPAYSITRSCIMYVVASWQIRVYACRNSDGALP